MINQDTGDLTRNPGGEKARRRDYRAELGGGGIEAACWKKMQGFLRRVGPKSPVYESANKLNGRGVFLPFRCQLPGSGAEINVKPFVGAKGLSFTLWPAGFPVGFPVRR